MFQADTKEEREQQMFDGNLIGLEDVLFNTYRKNYYQGKRDFSFTYEYFYPLFTQERKADMMSKLQEVLKHHMTVRSPDNDYHHFEVTVHNPHTLWVLYKLY